MPTIKRIKTALRKKSKEFIINLFMKAFAKLTKTEKIKMLLLIEKGRITSTIRRKTKRKTTKRKSKRSAKQRANDKRLGRMAKARARKRKR